MTEKYDTTDLQHNLLAFLKQTRRGTKVHWNTILQVFVYGGTHEEKHVTEAMNSIVFPNGPIHGVNSYYWFENHANRHFVCTK